MEQNYPTATNHKTGQRFIFKDGAWRNMPTAPGASPSASDTFLKARAMPGGVVNKLNEDIEAVGLSGALNNRIEPYRRETASGKINLGPIRNVFMDAQNWMGASSPESRRFATFKSDLEKMRNDSLRLNKGVQTEGDAIRAWNEILTNLNDEALVAERLRQIQSYNAEAMRQKRGIVDNTRSQYGLGRYPWQSVEPPRQTPTRKPPARNPRQLSDDDLRAEFGQ